MSNDRIYPPGVVPAAAVVLALMVVVCMMIGALLSRCDRPESVQMIAPVTSTATASTTVMATQSVRVTVKRAPTASRSPARQDAQEGPLPARQASQDPAIRAHEGDRGAFVDDGEEIVIEIGQAITSGATSVVNESFTTDPLFKNPAGNLNSDHGRLGIIAATMPGILAVDLQLYQVDASLVTRWLVDVPMEVGLDAVGNLEAGALGLSAGGKVFVGLYGWSKWDMGAQGVAVGAGMRF